MILDLERFQKKCDCGMEHHIAVKKIVIESGAVKYLEKILEEYKSPLIVCDTLTENAAKPYMSDIFSKIKVLKLEEKSIHADDHFVDVVEKKITQKPDILVAVGSGSIHDLTRYVAFLRKIPFVSVPTAASVDGFVSTVAAMTWHGMKKTMEAVAPICVLADTDIFSNAPYRLTASGISDLLGKYTALLDWKISHIVIGEYFCQSVYDLEMEAVREVEAVLHQIKKREPAAMEKLMYALLLSGLAMQMVGNSRPASGAEHHVSHLWEMEIINDHVDALHGEKVSIGLVLCMEYYESIRKSIAEGTLKINDQRSLETELLQETFGKKGLYENVLKENTPNLLEKIDLLHLKEKLPDIDKEISRLPAAEELKAKLKEAGCITQMEELNIPASIKELTLTLCPYVRQRLTLLRMAKLFDFCV